MQYNSNSRSSSTGGGSSRYSNNNSSFDSPSPRNSSRYEDSNDRSRSTFKRPSYGPNDRDMIDDRKRSRYEVGKGDLCC